jgi:hypothetical protein
MRRLVLRFWVAAYRFCGDRVRACSVPVRRPTIAELEVILASEDGGDGYRSTVIHLPDGSVVAV